MGDGGKAKDYGPTTVMVSGSFPPDVCGVGDYTGRLMESAPEHWSLFIERDWSVRAALGIIRRLLKLNPSDVVIQYPTQGYGWSLVPHLLAIIGALSHRYRTTFALHEFSSLSKKARLVLALVSHVADRFIFTTEVERDHARQHPLFSRRVPVSVIGIISNIPLSATSPQFHARTMDIAYFGHIRPNKGLENFLDVMQALRAKREDARIAIVGEIPAGYEDFGKMVSECAEAIGCKLILGLDDHAVARALCDVRILYLPFLDGVSARRGSVLAGLGNGTIIATRIGLATPTTLLPAIIPCDGTHDDVAKLLDALAMTDAQATALGEKGKHYVATTLPRDWSHVAMLYEGALGHSGDATC